MGLGRHESKGSEGQARRVLLAGKGRCKGGTKCGGGASCHRSCVGREAGGKEEGLLGAHGR